MSDEIDPRDFFTGTSDTRYTAQLRDGTIIDSIGGVPFGQRGLEQALINISTTMHDGKIARALPKSLHVGPEDEQVALQLAELITFLTVTVEPSLGRSWYVLATDGTRHGAVIEPGGLE